MMVDPRKSEFTSKEELREAVWAFMEKHDLVTFPRPCRGRVPNFIGAKSAAMLLTSLHEWERARVVFAAPDSSLHHARSEALRNSKTLLVAAPRLTGFYLIEGVLPEVAFEATSIGGFARFGRKVAVDPSLPRVDLYITGAVAVDKQGNRIGKGSGYGDQEDAVLTRAGLISPETPRVVLVHDVQLFDDFSRLMNEHDRPVTIIVTPSEVLRVWDFKLSTGD